MHQSETKCMLLDPHRMFNRLEAEPSREVAFGTVRRIYQLCKGEKERELRASGMDHCPACGRELGQRKEAALSL